MVKMRRKERFRLHVCSGIVSALVSLVVRQKRSRRGWFRGEQKEGRIRSYSRSSKKGAVTQKRKGERREGCVRVGNKEEAWVVAGARRREKGGGEWRLRGRERERS